MTLKLLTMLPTKKSNTAETSIANLSRASRYISFLLLSAWFLPGALAQEIDSELFPRPVELEPAIDFWTKVYTEIDTDHGYLHDSEDLSVIYAQLNRDNREIETFREKIKDDLLILASGERANLTENQEDILELWPDNVTRSRLERAANKVRWQLGQSNAFLEGLERSGAYRDHIDQVLLEKNMPPQLALLPHVESSFNPNAYSHANAAGMWQFTRPTGQRFMRIDNIIDERMDPYISAEAAMDLLEYNFQVLDSWPLALTAYNHGVGGMSRAVRETETSSIEKIIANYKGPRFGFVGRNFYPQFLAVNDIERNIDQYFESVDYAVPPNFTEVRLDSYVDSQGIEESLGIAVSQLREDNPSLRSVVWQGLKRIPRGYRVKVRTDQLPANTNFLAEIDNIYKHSTQLPDAYYEVQRGETLQTIASKFGTTPRQIASLNEIRNLDEIQAGQRISIPQAVRSSNDTLQIISARDNQRRANERNILETTEPPYDPEKNLAIRDTLPIETETLDENPTGPPMVTESAPDSNVNTNAAIAVEQMPQTPEILIEPEASYVNLEPDSLASFLDTDPSDYSVGMDNTIMVQASESIGQLANWLEIPTWDIRRLNNMTFRDQLIIGKKIQLLFEQVSQSVFENRRREFHLSLQADFFANYRIRGAEEYEIRRTDNINRLALNRYSTPLWLVRQYNPGINFSSVYVGQRVVFPLLESTEDSDIN